MRYYLIADTHADLTNIEEVRRAWRQVIDHARKAGKPAELWHLGDVFDVNRPAPLVYKAIIELVQESLPVFQHISILLGNHDNNDSGADALQPIEQAVQGEPVTIHRDGYYDGDRSLLVLPHIPRANMGADIPPSLSYNEAVQLLLKKVGMDKLEPKVIMGHLLFKQAQTGAENALMRDKALTLDSFNAKTVFMGHIHKPQELSPGKGQHVVYIGSTQTVDFAERDEEKRCLIYDDEAGEVASMPFTGARPWVQVELDFTKSFKLPKLSIPKGALVKVAVKVNKSQLASLNMEQVLSQITEAGGTVTARKVEKVDDLSTETKAVEAKPGEGDFEGNIKQAIEDYLKPMSLTKPQYKKALELCLSLLDVGKYRQSQKGHKFVLTGVELTNFFSYRKARLTFPDGLTGIIGDNGAGKSTIIDAIIYALTGEERGSKAGCSMNTGAEKAGEKKMEVTLYLKVGALKVELTRGRNGSKPYAELRLGDGSDPVSGEQAVTARVAELLGVDYDTLVNTSFFREEFQDAFLKAKAGARETFLSDFFGLAFIGDAHATAVKMKNQAKADSDRAKTAMDSYESQLKGYGDIEAMKAEAKSSREKAKELGKAYDEGVAELREAAKLEEKASRAKGVERELGAVIEGLEKASVELANAEHDLPDMRQAQKSAETEAKQASEAMTRVREELGRVGQELEAAKTYQDILESKAGECPVCGVLPGRPKLTKEQHEALLGIWQATIEKLTERQQVLNHDKLTAGAEASQAEKEAGKRRLEATEAERIIKQAGAEKASLTARQKKLEAEAKEAEEARKKLVSLDVAKKQRELDKLSEQRDGLLEKASQLEAEVDQYAKLEKALRQAHDQWTEAGAQYTITSACVAVYDRSGVVVNMMRAITESIAKWANVLLESMSTDPIEVLLDKHDKGVDVMVDWNGGVKEYAMYSGGERTLINFAVRLGFSLTLSELTGFVPSVLLLDEVLGKLSPDNRANFVKLLDYVGKRGFRQVLLITHSDVKDYLNQTLLVRKVAHGEEKVSEVVA